MLVIELDFLCGRFFGASVTDREQAEWPPHPSRLFSALVAAHHLGEGGRDEEVALEWLEAQPPPTISASEATQRDVVPVFVPVNDARPGSPKLIPELREKKERRFPSATPTNPLVHYTWCSDPALEVRAALTGLCGRVAAVGHSSSLVLARVTPGAPAATHVPDARGALQLRTPVRGQWEALREAFRRHRGTLPRSLPTGYTNYRVQRRDGPAEPVEGIWSPDWLLMRIRQPLTLRGTLAVAEALRNTIMSKGPQPPPAWISGHESSGEPARIPHLAIAPLADVAHPHARGFVMGLAVMLPMGLTLEERAILRSILRGVTQLRAGGRTFETELVEERPDRQTLLPRTWQAPSVTWASVTPVVLDRYPDKPFGEETRATISDAVRRIGFPAPADVSVGPVSPLLAVPMVREFPVRRKPGVGRRWQVHATLRFHVPVKGPVIIGAGRHFGYGLFRPWQPD